jgi:hypothetical protein
MKFNNIITETLIDSADLPKGIKNILKYIFNEYANDHDIGIDRANFTKMVIDLSKKFSISPTNAVKALELYEKYKDVFFREDVVQDFLPELTFDNSESFLYAVSDYLYKKYEGKEIYNSGRIAADFFLMENPENSYYEDMLGNVNASIHVNFSDLKEFTNLGYGDSWMLHLYMSFNVFRDGRTKVGYDIIDIEEIVGGVNDEYPKPYKNIETEVIGSGNVKSAYFNTPKYFDDEEVAKFGDRVVEIMKKIIRKHHHDIEGFGEWLKHGGDDIFENYKKR